MEYYNYSDLGITSAQKPISPHLWFETAAGGLYLIKDPGQLSVYYSADKGDNWSQLDVDSANRSGDNKSRLYTVQAAWHDLINKIIWFVDCNNPGDEFEVWTLDYSASESGPTITEVGTGSAGTADANTVYAWDIFHIGSEYFVINDEERAGSTKLVVWDVDSAPFGEEDNLNASGATIGRSTLGVVVGQKYYFIVERNGIDMQLQIYDHSITTISDGDTLNAYSVSTTLALRGMSYDNDNLMYVVLEKDADNKNYLCIYDITADSLTASVEHSISLMLDRNTASGVNEKAFHLTSYEVYEIHPNKKELYLISKPDSDAALIALTDSFLMNSDGDMWEFIDHSQYISFLRIERAIMQIPMASVKFSEDITLNDDLFVIIEDMFTTASTSASATIFEGYIEGYTERRKQVVNLVSPAKELLSDKLYPSGDYSGRTDEIIEDLLADYCSYVVPGTLNNGTAMGTITFGGNKSIFQIINEFALTDNFIWYLTPTGELYYNNGTTDSGEDFTAASDIREVHSKKEVKPINYVQIRGAYVSGIQVQSAVYDNEENWRRFGKNPYLRTFSHLDTTALCNTTANNILSRWGSAMRKISFVHQDSTVGLIQEGETITFEYGIGNPTISSDQFLIIGSVYYPIRGLGTYTCSDAIV